MTKPYGFLALISLLTACSVPNPIPSSTDNEISIPQQTWSIQAVDKSLLSRTDNKGELWVTKQNDEGLFFMRIDKSVSLPISEQEEWFVVPAVKDQIGSGKFYELYLFKHTVMTDEWRFQSSLPLGDRIKLKDTQRLNDNLVCLHYLDYALEQSFAEEPSELKTVCVVVDESKSTLNRVRSRNMQGFVTLIERPLPILTGRYTYTYLVAEERKAVILTDVEIDREKRTLTSRHAQSQGLMVYGTGEILFHTPSQQWILLEKFSDEQAEDVGGCAGPVVLDFNHQILKGC